MDILDLRLLAEKAPDLQEIVSGITSPGSGCARSKIA
jgi:hypothetical protein